MWRSTLPENVLRKLVDTLGVVSWARCGALLSKQLATMVPQDIVVSTDDFKALMQGPDPEVSCNQGYARTWLLNTVCLQELFLGPAIAPSDSFTVAHILAPA